jgi:galactokinase
LPFAIGAGVTVGAAPIDGDRIVATAADLAESEEFPLYAVTPAPGWRAFVRGAVAELQRAGFPLRGAWMTISGDVPIGAGLSSSAAMSVALCLALLAVAAVPAPGPAPVALAQICSAIENRWVGAQTGLLDQLASLCGREGHALAIDFRSLAVEPVPLKLGAYRLVTLAAGTPRALAGAGTRDGAGYNDRRDECREACQLLGLTSLRDATLADAARLPDPLDRRVRHVVAENARVRAAVDALRRGEVAALGELLNDSHASLRDDYEVSVPAVEAARETLLRGGALGARIVGGGFGGSVLGLLPPGVGLPAGALEHIARAGARILE